MDASSRKYKKALKNLEILCEDDNKQVALKACLEVLSRHNNQQNKDINWFIKEKDT